MNPDKFAKITRGGDLNRVLAGIEAAKRVGLTPVKLNVVALGGFNDDEFADFIELTRKEPYVVRFIELMPIGHAEVGGFLRFCFKSGDSGSFSRAHSGGR